MSLQEELFSFISSVSDMFRCRAAETPGGLVFLDPDQAPEGPSQWTRYTWAEPWLLVDQLAIELLARRLSHEQRVGIISTIGLGWILLDLAVAYVVGAITMVYLNTAAGDVKFTPDDSGTYIAVVEDTTQLTEVGTSPIPGAAVHTIVVIDAVHVELNGRVISYIQLQLFGTEQLKQNPGIVGEAIASTGHDTLSTPVYTSGTTGQLKGVRLNRVSWICEGSGTKYWRIIDDSDLQYLRLSFSHAFGKALVVCQIAYEFASAVDRRIDWIVDGLGEAKPTLMRGAPRTFEKVRATVMAANTGPKNRISRWAFVVGHGSRGYRLSGLPMPGSLALKYQVADVLVLSKLKAKPGRRMKFMVSSSAELSAQMQEWFYLASLLIVEGYGPMETPATAFLNISAKPCPGSVGKVVSRIGTKFAEDGEVLLHGPIITPGYYNLSSIMAEVLSDGWHHTGDLGEFDTEGNLTITDHKKDPSKTSDGKCVTPQRVGGAVTVSIPHISQAIMVRDGRKYCFALLVLGPALLWTWTEKCQLRHLSYAKLSRCPRIRASIEKQMAKADAHFGCWEITKRFVILDHELTVDNGGATPNIKIRRVAVTRRYGDIVDSLYDVEERRVPHRDRAALARS